MNSSISPGNENSPEVQTQLDPIVEFNQVLKLRPILQPLDRVWGILKRKMDFNKEYLLEHRIVDGIKDLYTLGRSNLSDLKVDHRLISSRHCKIYCDYSNPKMRILIEDTSSNGTFINDSLTRLSKGTCMELRSGDEIFLVNPRKITDPNELLATSFTFINIRDRLATNREISTAPLQRPESIRAKNERSIEDHYIIGDIIGSGMSGQVYFCINRLTKQRCAVKVIDIRKFALTPGLSLQDLQREAEIMMQLKHPNIIQVYDTFQTNSAIYIVMELVEGGDLFDKIIEKETLSEPIAKAIMKNILSAIEYLHSKKIIHRDLKPENILLVSDKDETFVKVTDFGLAKKVSQEGLRTFCGTPQYFAPEVLKRKDSLRGMGRYGMSADIWSLGVILYIMLCGNFPFEEENLYNHIEKAQYNFSASIWNTISSSAKHFIKSLLTSRPEDRLTISQALNHPWISNKDFNQISTSNLLPIEVPAKAFPELSIEHKSEELSSDKYPAQNLTQNIPLLPYQSNLVPSTISGDNSNRTRRSNIDEISPLKKAKYFRFSFPAEKSYIANDKEVSGDEIGSFSSDEDDQFNRNTPTMDVSKTQLKDCTNKSKKRKLQAKPKESPQKIINGSKYTSLENNNYNKENNHLNPSSTTKRKKNLLRTPMRSLAILFQSFPVSKDTSNITD